MFTPDAKKAQSQSHCYSFNFNLRLHFMAGFVVVWKLASNLAFIFMQS